VALGIACKELKFGTLGTLGTLGILGTFGKVAKNANNAKKNTWYSLALLLAGRRAEGVAGGDSEKDDAAGGGAHGGDGTAESARVLLIPLESARVLLIPTGYHSTRPPFVKGVAGKC